MAFHYLFCMLGKGPLWKNIGKEDTLKSPESSISSGSRPIKTFHIMFEDQMGSKSEIESEIAKKSKNSHYFQPSESIKEVDQFDGTPMIITEDGESRKPRNEEVCEVISFDSLENGKDMNMNHILRSMQQINEPAKNDNKLLLLSSHIAHLSEKPSSRNYRNKIGSTLSIIKLLKRDFQNYKFYLLNVMSEWEVQAINSFKNMKDNINRYLGEICEEINKKREKPKEIEDSKSKYNALQQEITLLNKTLSGERSHLELIKRENLELSDKIKKIERNNHQQRYKMGNQQTLADQFKSKTKKLEYQLSETKLELQSQSSKVGKLKQVIKERQVYISSQVEELTQLQKKIKDLKITNEQTINRERKFEIELKSLRERSEKQTVSMEKQLSKSKSESTKLKSLLKTSQEQLNQCQEYINKLNKQVKQLQLDLTKSHEKMRENEGQYYKKLQQCDKYLLQLENNIKQMTIGSQYRQQEYLTKESQFFRMKEEFENRNSQLKNREYQIEQLKQQYEHKILNLQRRQDGMRAEYKMAMEAQNAVKDKWYERYYTMISPQRAERQRNTYEKVMVSPPHRDINPLSPRTSYPRMEPLDIPIRDAKSPTRDRLVKAKSQRNLNINTFRSDAVSLNSARNEFNRSEAQKGIVNLGSRINTLRRELTRELGQISSP